MYFEALLLLVYAIIVDYCVFLLTWSFDQYEMPLSSSSVIVWSPRLSWVNTATSFLCSQSAWYNALFLSCLFIFKVHLLKTAYGWILPFYAIWQYLAFNLCLAYLILIQYYCITVLLYYCITVLLFVFYFPIFFLCFSIPTLFWIYNIF